MNCWLLTALFGTNVFAAQSLFYDFTIIAKTGDPIQPNDSRTFQSFKKPPSINSNGKIAIIGVVQGGDETVVLWNGSQNILLGSPNSGDFGPAVINDADLVATRLLRTSGGNSVSTIRRYSGPNSFITLDAASNMRINGIPLYTYASFLSDLSMSSIGTVVYSAMDHNQRSFLVANNHSLLVHSTPVPAIAQNIDLVLIKPFAQSVPTILLYPASTFAAPESVANSTDFTLTGARPGIIDEGTVAAFYGERLNGGVLEQGIYVSTKSGTGWQWQPIVTSGFTSFAANKPVAIKFADCNLQSILVVFMASKLDPKTQQAKLGIYTVRLGLPSGGNTLYSFGPANLVMQVGDAINGLTGTVQDLDIQVPLNKNGQIAFWAQVQQTGIATGVIVIARPKLKGFHQGSLTAPPAQPKFEPGVPPYFGKTPVPNTYHDNCSDPQTGRDSMGCHGCALCSAATMLTTFPGLGNWTPGDLDNALLNLNHIGYCGRAQMDWYAIRSATGNLVELVDRWHPQNPNTVDSDFQTYLVHHFCELAAC